MIVFFEANKSIDHYFLWQQKWEVLPRGCYHHDRVNVLVNLTKIRQVTLLYCKYNIKPEFLINLVFKFLLEKINKIIFGLSEVDKKIILNIFLTKVVQIFIRELLFTNSLKSIILKMASLMASLISQKQSSFWCLVKHFSENLEKFHKKFLKIYTQLVFKLQSQ